MISCRLGLEWELCLIIDQLLRLKPTSSNLYLFKEERDIKYPSISFYDSIIIIFFLIK